MDVAMMSRYLRPLSPAIHNRVQENHVHPRQGREIEDGVHHGGRVPVKHVDEERGHEIPARAANHQQGDACGTIPPFDLPDGLGLMGLLDNIDDVRAADGPSAQQEQHRHHISGKGQGQQIGPGGQRRETSPESPPETAETAATRPRPEDRPAPRLRRRNPGRSELAPCPISLLQLAGGRHPGPETHRSPEISAGRTGRRHRW